MQPVILLLENDEDDLYITQSLFKEIGFNAKLEVVKSPAELLLFLHEQINKRASLPKLILLNYNAAPVGAADIVQKLKSSPVFNHIPVVVGCGSANQEMIRDCYSKGVSSFIQKAHNTTSMKKSMTMFFDYWFKCVLLP